jgi:Bacteriocin-protection, YdeI or OmpD-Associated/Domain of unknown function (DUF1905)
MDSLDHPYVFPARIHKIWIMRCVNVPRDISKSLRALAGAGVSHIPVHGWIEGLPFQSTLTPAGGGRFRLHVHSRIWRKLRIDAGAAVEVTLFVDTQPRQVVLPPDLAVALASTPRALAAFNAQTIAFRRQLVTYVDTAKQARTRDQRIQLLIRRMLERAAKRKKPKPNKKTVRKN